MPTTDYVAKLINELEDINKLETTVDLIRSLAIQTLEKALKQNIANVQARQIIENGKDALSKISDSSIADNYKVIYSQMCVLAVSSFEAILKSYFEHAADYYHNLSRQNERLKNIKVSVDDIIENNLRFGGKLGKLILEKDKPNFQDLQSILRVFKDYFGKEIELRDQTRQYAVFYLEARHVLVHKGGKVDEKFLTATSKLKASFHSLKLNDPIELGQEDWMRVRSCFIDLVEAITAQRPIA